MLSGQPREEPYSAPYNPHDVSRDPSVRSQQQPQDQPPDPARKSMFEYSSPFDAMPSVKKKPVPAQPTSSSSGNEGSWTTASMTSDPKRKPDNLLGQFDGRGPASTNVQAENDPYYPYAGEELSQPESRAPPLPSKLNQSASPSPPRSQAQAAPRPQRRSADSPLSQVGPPGPAGSNRRDKDSPPGTFKNGKGAGVKSKNQGYLCVHMLRSRKFTDFRTQRTQPQTILFDVSQPLEDIQAGRDAVLSTAIALVRQDSVFLPGTTIGATHWVAYAMTRGQSIFSLEFSSTS
jgi:hypothetical protein